MVSPFNSQASFAKIRLVSDFQIRSSRSNFEVNYLLYIILHFWRHNIEIKFLPTCRFPLPSMRNSLNALGSYPPRIWLPITKTYLKADFHWIWYLNGSTFSDLNHEYFFCEQRITTKTLSNKYQQHFSDTLPHPGSWVCQGCLPQPPSSELWTEVTPSDTDQTPTLSSGPPQPWVGSLAAAEGSSTEVAPHPEAGGFGPWDALQQVWPLTWFVSVCFLLENSRVDMVLFWFFLLHPPLGFVTLRGTILFYNNDPWLKKVRK